MTLPDGLGIRELVDRVISIQDSITHLNENSRLASVSEQEYKERLAAMRDLQKAREETHEEILRRFRKLTQALTTLERIDRS